jgi:SAM-dependent methyltransferase
VIAGNLESILNSGATDLGAFDCIIMADVIEHLLDPWLCLSQCASMLTDDGCLVLSVPNVSHLSILLPLIAKDRWSYEDHGILDRGHLRFFTLSELKSAVSDAGLRVDAIESKQYSWDDYSKKMKLFALLLHLTPKRRRMQYLTVQWLLRCRREPS